MDSYGSNYAYGSSPTYKDEGQAGVILVNKIDDTNQAVVKTFPVLDLIPSKYRFGVTGLSFSPKKYLWDFGDGTGSEERNPVHTYSTPGYQDVLLSVMDNHSVWYRIEEGFSHNVVLGKLDFEGVPLRGDKPLEVTFEDVSYSPTGCSFTGMQWDFGDTYGATGANPAPHTYLDYGTYTVGVDALMDNT